MFYGNLEHFKSTAGYEIDGIWYPRVTAIVSIKAKPALYKFYGDQKSFKAGEAVKSKSAEEGTLLHETIEAILNKKEVAIPDLIKPAVNAFLDLQRQIEITPIKIEERVVSKKHRYAGTLDVLAKVDGKLCIVDIKTSNSIYRDYNIQTSAYVQAVLEDNPAPLSRMILRIDQAQVCKKCGAKMRSKGGNIKIRGGEILCNHAWDEVTGEIELKEITDFEKDFKAFLASKDLWEWENENWLKQIGY